MRAMAAAEFGALDKIQLMELPAPEPGEHDLLVEVHAAGLNPVDWKILKGAFAQGRKKPFVMGWDLSGVVRGMGKKVEGFKIGDGVYASPGLMRDGAAAELACVDARTAAIKPRKLDHTQSAALPLVALTGWGALYQRAKVRAREIVLIHAGGGGVGHVAIQLARFVGCRVIATASREDSMQLARACGAEAVINYQTENLAARVAELTGGEGCDVIFDTVGGAVLDRAAEDLAVNGRLITCVGTESGRVFKGLFIKNATLHFEFMGSATMYGINLRGQGRILREAAELVDAGKLTPHVSRVFPMERIADGYRELMAGHTTGKIVVQVR